MNSELSLHDLDEDSLIAIIRCDERNAAALHLLRAAEERNGLESLVDEARRAWWTHRLANVNVLDDDAIGELASLPRHSSARAIIGEAAQQDKLTTEGIQSALEQMQEDEWSYKQLVARNLVHTLQQNATIGDVISILAEILESGAAWAVLECLPLLADRTLKDLYGRITPDCGLNRHDRHQVKETIREVQRVRSRKSAER